jgi:DedD protein
MDPALKQRLIGAAVLVALAVIFLPMLIGGPEPTATRRSEVSLDMPPAPERPLQTREIPLTLPVPAAAPAAPPASRPVDPDAIVTVDANAAPRIDARPEDQPTPTPAPRAEAPVAVAATPAAAPPAAIDAAAPVAAATPAVAAPAEPAGTRFVVNLGSYGNAANAEALRIRLRDAGLKVYGEPIQIDGRPATRLRAGPYASRAEAEAARVEARRQQADVTAAVVVLEGSAPGPAPARPVGAGFAVQVGALASESEANTLAGRLRGAGFSAYVERAQTDSGTLWRVRAGPELQRDRAERLREEIRTKLRLDGLVVAHP